MEKYIKYIQVFVIYLVVGMILFPVLELLYTKVQGNVYSYSIIRDLSYSLELAVIWTLLAYLRDRKAK